MYTVYLLRDPNATNPNYLIFVADQDEQVIPETIFSETKYSAALLRGGVLFELFVKALRNCDLVNSYIESPYESKKVVSYSSGQFRAKKTGDHDLFISLIDKYESLLVSYTPEDAYKKVAREGRLTPEQKIQLLHFLSIRPEAL